MPTEEKLEPRIGFMGADLGIESALQDGIAVDAEKWEALNAAAWPILVPASAQSHAGAGPG